MLELKNVTKTFGKFVALDDLTMGVPQGAVYGLIGPNGAGKTTAISCLSGVYRPEKGEATLEGMKIFENPTAKMRMFTISDDVFFFPSATMEEMRRFYQGIYPQFDASLYQTLSEAFALPKKTPLRQFSKGMQKQAAFQLALSTRPEVLILDEPVDGLDPVMRRQICGLIMSSVAQENATVLISSHNLRELEDLCDHVGVMHRGKMLMERSLSDMQGLTHKVQIVGDIPEGLQVLHSSQSGRLSSLIVRGTTQEIAAKVQAVAPTYFDILPLSLEEIFIYELEDVNYEVKNIVL